MVARRTRAFAAWTVGVAMALGIGGAAAQETDWLSVEIETTDLGNGIYMMVGRGGNMGLSVGEDATFLVDDQYAPLSGKIKRAISAITDRPTDFVVNTHWHFDHTGGNEPFGDAGAWIVAHHNVRKRMSTDQVMEAFGRTVPAAPDAALPVITFDEGVTFHVNGEDIRIVHVPAAHTDGDAIVWFDGADVVHMGDIFFNGFYPFIDTGSGGDIDGMIAAMDMVLAEAGSETRIIPGHGPLASVEDLRRTRDMLATVRERVSAAMDGGQSLDEIQDADILADLNEEWAGFVDGNAIVAAAYTSLSD